jgi:hypothetical protein
LFNLFLKPQKAQRPQSFFFFFLRALGVLSGLTLFFTFANIGDHKGEAKGAKTKAAEVLLVCRCNGYKFLAFGSIQAKRRNNGSQERGKIGLF